MSEQNEITINNETCIKKSAIPKQTKISRDFVLVRSYDSGVHFGYLTKRDDATRCVELTNSRRIHHWSGATCCSQIAITGIGKPKESRVSMVLPTISIFNVIEIIPCTEEAKANLEAQPIWKV